MHSDLLVFNGIDGATGGYLTPPTTPADLAGQIVAYARGEVLDEDSRRHYADLQNRQQQKEARLGVIPGVDATRLSEAGWGVIFAADQEHVDDLRAALRPLLELRRSQAGARYKEFVGQSGYRRGESKSRFLARQGMGSGPADPDIVPYYLLIVGAPDQIPYRFQYQLDVQYAVGRIHFADLSQYEQYAATVVAAESGQVRLPRRAVFFAAENPDDRSTQLSAEYLAGRLAKSIAEKQAGWQVTPVLRDQASKQRLSRLLAGPQTPALLFTATHGLAFPNGHPRQLSDQGALLCSDWPGPEQWSGPIPREHYFSTADVAADARLAGLITFHFACFGAGTPRSNDFIHRSAREESELAPHPFVARLPQRLLGHPAGGALAVIGHVERVWAYSYLEDDLAEAMGQPHLTVFESALARLMAGQPVGYALEYFNERYAELATTLNDELYQIRRRRRPNEQELIALWTANNDARSYVIVGDPAVRLPLAGDDEPEPARPTISLATEPASTAVARPAAPPAAAPASTPSAQPFAGATTPSPQDQAGPGKTGYADLEIRILERQEQGYPVELTLNSEQEFQRGFLDPAFLPWVPSEFPDEDGVRLFRWLFADGRLLAAWHEVCGQHPRRRIRLRIDARAPELHSVPWELLREPASEQELAHDLAADSATPFSRYLAGRWQPGSPILQRPIRILVAIANPYNLDDYGLEPLDVVQEWSLLKEATAGLEVELTRYPQPTASVTIPARGGQPVTIGGREQPCTLDGLEAELRKGYHGLHFIGHGSYDRQLEETTLYMADVGNQVALVSDQDLTAMLARQLADSELKRDDRLRLVFLASCQTATRSPADAFRGLAPQLVAAGVPAVLAMQDLVPVATARTFAATFYRRLLEHGLVDQAANEARAAVLTANLSAATAPASRASASVPVLFMRLRNGRLLGRRGRITSAHEERFWPYLLRNIDEGLCTPFLGPRVTAGLLPRREAIAEKLADQFGYPLPDRARLVRVAQFMAVDDPGVLRSAYLRLLRRGLSDFLDIKPTREQRQQLRHATLAETAEALNWAQAVLAVQENEIHHLLADLELPLYVTTNVDSFMVEALKAHGRPARRIGPRWQQPQAGTPQFVLSPPPSRERPVVLHLNGHDGDPEQLSHLVLSEDDYLAHFVRLCRDQESILPMNVLQMLSEHSFIFLGYQLDDWEFRVILQGLLKPIAQTNQARKMHVGVQLEPDRAPSAQQAMDYLGRYLGQFHIDIYWGTSQQFVTELHARWEEYLEAGDDDW